MKLLLSVAVCCGLLAAPALAQPRSPQHGPAIALEPAMRPAPHPIWKKGGTISRSDWDRGGRVDYRRYHLTAPAPGYEWRRVDNHYILASIRTGRILSIVRVRR